MRCPHCFRTYDQQIYFNPEPDRQDTFASIFLDTQDSTWYRLWVGDDQGKTGEYVDTDDLNTEEQGWVERTALEIVTVQLHYNEYTELWVQPWGNGVVSEWHHGPVDFNAIIGPREIMADDFYMDFIDDFPTTVSRELKTADTLYFYLDPVLDTLAKQWFRESFSDIDRIIAKDVIESTGEDADSPQIKVMLGDTQGYFACTFSSGRIHVAENFISNSSGGYPHGKRTARHEIGHALGLSHPGADADGTKPDDWNTETSPLNPDSGANIKSDENTLSPDGNRLSALDTIMAYTRTVEPYADPRYRWMDVMILRDMYGANQAVPEAKHFDK